jgi:predicted SAM-dependent methyltransferase
MCTHGIDIGYGGDDKKTFLNYVGYDTDHKDFDPSGKMPFKDGEFQSVYSSHCLEHIVDYKTSIREWFRILETGGNMMLLLPHKFLYEKKETLPGLYNQDHKRFYTPASLLLEIEESLEPNSYRVVLLRDFDHEYDYGIPPEKHAKGNYSILCVIQKIKKPEWGLLG